MEHTTNINPAKHNNAAIHHDDNTKQAGQSQASAIPSSVLPAKQRILVLIG
jgi:hypothetical protein